MLQSKCYSANNKQEKNSWNMSSMFLDPNMSAIFSFLHAEKALKSV